MKSGKYPVISNVIISLIVLSLTFALFTTVSANNSQSKLRGVTYKLNKNVIDISSRKSLRDILTTTDRDKELGYYIESDSEVVFYKDPGLAIGQIYVDKRNNFSFKVCGIAKNSKGETIILYVKPKVEEVFDDIEIPEQSVDLNMNNINPGSQGDGVEISKTKKDFIEFKIDKTLIDKKHATGKIDATFKLYKPQFVGHMSLKKGIFAFKTMFSQSNKIKFDGEVKNDFNESFKLCTLAVPFGFGAVNFDMVLNLSTDGSQTISIDFSNDSDFVLGVGGRIEQFPFSIYGLKNLSGYKITDYKLDHKLDGSSNLEIEIAPELAVKVLNLDIIKVDAQAKVNISSSGSSKNDSSEINLEGYIKSKSYLFTKFEYILLDKEYEFKKSSGGGLFW